MGKRKKTGGGIKMDYYKLKRQALTEIKQLAEKGVSSEDICFFIYEKFGLGQRFVINYYDELQARGFVKTKKKK